MDVSPIAMVSLDDASDGTVTNAAFLIVPEASVPATMKFLRLRLLAHCSLLRYSEGSRKENVNNKKAWANNIPFPLTNAL